MDNLKTSGVDMNMDVDMSVDFCGVHFKNPVTVASGSNTSALLPSMMCSDAQ